VYAYKSELDTWFDQRRAPNGNNTDNLPDNLQSEEPPAAAPGSIVRVATIAAIAVVLCVIAVASYFMGKRATPAATKKIKVAVLPFKNLNGDAEQDYFSDGLTEEMISQLGRLHPESLGIIGRTSAMLYKSTSKSLIDIGQELKVDYLLEGSVRREGDRVRITAQLIDAKDQTHLWAETYDRNIHEALTLQAEVAAQVSGSLAPKLLNAGASTPAHYVTNNSVALESYLKGRYLWNRGFDGFAKSIEHFEAAISADPQFALAHAGLAEGWAMLGRYGMRPPKECYPQAKAAAERAVNLDSSLAEAHAAMAVVKFYWEWDWSAAEREFVRAIELNPSLAGAHHSYAHFLSAMGRHDESIAEVKRAQELEPLSAAINSDAGWFYYRARRYDEAIAECRRVLEIEPGFYSAQACIIDVLQKQERYEEARQAIQKSLEGQTAPLMLEALKTPDPKEAIEKVVQLRLKILKERQGGEDYIPPYAFAAIYAKLNQPDNAFEWLETAYNVRDNVVLLLKVNPVFDSIRNDARYAEMIKRVGLPVG
jgi:TolB-like protein